MLRKKKKFSLLLLNLFLPFTAYAISPSHYVVAPSCLIKNANTHYQILSTQGDLQLIKTDNTGIDKLSEAKKRAKCGGFMDVTDDWLDFKHEEKNKASMFLREHLTIKAIPKQPKAYAIKYPNQVKQAYALFNDANMWSYLTTYSAFHDRYYNSDNGLAASVWIQNKMKQIAGNRSDVSIYTIPTVNRTGSYKQPSVVVKVSGTSNPALPGIVIGAHMDTESGFMPGADDDGSGTVTVLETARVLLTSKMKFKKPIYFIWYAAEEVGLVGSKIVVDNFIAKQIPVSEVLQLDMTGYPDRTNPTAIWLMDDYVNRPLTNYVELLIKTYVKKPVMRNNYCGYACSDHASWYRKRFAAAMPFEASMNNYNPDIHTAEDTKEKLVPKHMNDYALLAIAFAVELAEPATTG